MKLTKLIGGMLGSAFALLAVFAAPAVLAEGHGPQLMEFRVDTANLAGLQRGARDFRAYCSGCHGLKYLRYNRMGADLGLTDALVKDNFMTEGDKPGDQMKVAMPPAAADWFGAQPPDLSLEARARGPAWVYTYLNSFYLDPARPLGVNNTILPNASMPHVLWELQGWQQKVEHHEAKAGEEHGEHAKPFELVEKGSMTPEEYKKFTADITNFLVYAAEPGRNARMDRGWSVFFFLLVLFVLAYMLKKEYWKDVH